MRLAIYRYLLNFWPCLRGTGARVTFISKDFKKLSVKIPLNWRTRNYVGTIFGGSIYGATDPFYMIMLIKILGKDFVVWDKGATIRFKRPGLDTLFVNFEIKDSDLERIKKEVAQNKEYVFTWTVHLKNTEGTIHAEVDKVLYVAEKKFYEEKLKRKRSSTLPFPTTKTA